MNLTNPHSYVGRSVYSQDGFTHGKVASIAMRGGEVVWVNVELDLPNAEGETRVKQSWEDCKFA